MAPAMSRVIPSLFRAVAPLRRSTPLPSSQRFVATVIDGKKVRAAILERVTAETALLPSPPGLTVIQVGGHSDSTVYVNHKMKAAEGCGMVAKHIKLPRDTTQSDILATIHQCNEDPTTHGILLQLPLDTEKPVEQDACLNSIDPAKDVDGLHYINAGLLSRGELNNCLLPCTPRGCIELIKSTGQPIAGAKAVVLGRSAIVGTPMAELLKWNNATVTIAHSKTKNMKELCQNADIVVAACRQEEMVEADWLKPGAIVIDVGIHAVPDATKKSGFRLTGDVNYKSAREVAGWITPVPGHVGPMTVAMVVQNTLDCAKRFMLADKHSWNLRPLSLRGGEVDALSEAPAVPSDLHISQAAKPKQIQELCKELRLFPHEYSISGHFKAKLNLSLEDRFRDATLGKYVVVSGVTPTPLGEGKTTTACGVTQALGAHLGKNVIATLRQPALGPLFSLKGGAAGGGYSQVIPMEEFNSHLTGDLHAIAAAQNLLAAAVDSRIAHEASAVHADSRIDSRSDDKFFSSLVNCTTDADGNVSGGSFSPTQRARLERLGIKGTTPADLDVAERRRFAFLDIDPQTMVVSRVVDMNDEMFRRAILGSRRSRFPLKRKFENTTACEMMNIMSLCRDLDDFQERVGRIIVALDRNGQPITADDIGAGGAATWLMHEAIKPTLMQTLEGTPILVHAGPFANVGTGNCSVIADRMALKLVGSSGYAVTEAGHGADAGLEKFFHIKCRTSGLFPNCVVLVATTRALKAQGGEAQMRYGGSVPESWTQDNLELLMKGGEDLRKQIDNSRQFGVPVVVAVNAFTSDSDAELAAVCKMALEFGAVDASICRHWEQGGRGAIELAEKVIKVCEDPAPPPSFLYDLEAPVETKIEAVARAIHRSSGVEFSPLAKENIKNIERLGYSHLPLCISRSPFKSGNGAGTPMVIQDVRLAAGAGIIVPEVDKTVTMPMLPARPSFYDIEWRDGKVHGMK